MIYVSEAWRDIQNRFLLNETFVEIDCTIAEVGIQDSATIVGNYEAAFSTSGGVLRGATKTTKYATCEHNLWALDGTMQILPSMTPTENTGYISSIDGTGNLKINFPVLHTEASSGVTITWGSRFGEYPSIFTVTAKLGDTVVSETTVTDNTDQVSSVFSVMEDYDNIEVTVHTWCLPHRRVRIEKVIIGNVLTLRKDDLFDFTHTEIGHLNSGDLPKNSIEFTLDNTSGRWDPSNPNGMERYLAERQKMVVRYGLDIGDSIEWIPAGTFYLSEWRVPANGIEATFVARDVFEYLLNENYAGRRSGTLTDLILDAFESAGTPGNFTYILSPALDTYSATLPTGDYTCAEVVQMCANACECIIHQDRDGVLHIEPLDTLYTGEYVIGSALSYSHPEVELTKPLKSVSVSYGDDTYALEVGISGETQTVNNPLVGSIAQAESIAEWVKKTLNARKIVSGEYRADPRLDVFDLVAVEGKYGEISPVAITEIVYSYTGSFKGRYKGRVLEVTG